MKTVLERTVSLANDLHRRITGRPSPRSSEAVPRTAHAEPTVVDLRCLDVPNYPEEELVPDARAGLRPAEQVEKSLESQMQNCLVPVSQLRSALINKGRYGV